MMQARKGALDGQARVRRFDRKLFATQSIRLRRSDVHGARRSDLVDRAVDHLATSPDGDGIGYCLLEGAAQLMTLGQVRGFSSELLREVWLRFRSRSPRISEGRDFFAADTLTSDGGIPTELFGSEWTFKPPHADRNGVLFAHVYGPATGFAGGNVFVIDALAYMKERDLRFDDAFVWSEGSDDRKPVLRPEHVDPALASYGRVFGQLDHDSVLLVNNSPEGLLHGATELRVTSRSEFSRVLHRCVVRERSAEDFPSPGHIEGLRQ